MGSQEESRNPSQLRSQPEEGGAGRSNRRRYGWLWMLLVVAAVAALAAAVAIVPANLRLVRAEPAGGVQQVPITAPLRLMFSQEPDLSSLEPRFQIEPGVSGVWAVEGKVAIFVPDRALEPDIAYTVTLAEGVRSRWGRTLRGDHVWQFRTRQPDLLYLGRPVPGAEVRQLFRAPVGGAPVQLTDQPMGVWDYDVHPQGEAVVYSVLREDGGTDLWRMDREGGDQEILLACPEVACLNPAWSPDGGLLAYERRDIWAGAPNLDPKAGRIWLLDLEQEEERPLFDYEVALHSPGWAPRGQRLAYTSPTIPGVEVYDLETGELQQFGNQWGAPPAWSPDGTRLVLPELLMAGEELAVRLVRVDLAVDHLADDQPADESLADISGDDDFVKDVAPAWSPGGGWIAFARQFLDAERWTPGRQIWLSRPDASEAYGLPPEPMFDHYSLAWRPDGGALAYARADLGQGVEAIPDVSVWVFDFHGREARQAGQDAVLPKWLP